MNKTERKFLGQVTGKWLKPDADVEECRAGKTVYGLEVDTVRSCDDA